MRRDTGFNGNAASPCRACDDNFFVGSLDQNISQRPAFLGDTAGYITLGIRIRRRSLLAANWRFNVI